MKHFMGLKPRGVFWGPQKRSLTPGMDSKPVETHDFFGSIFEASHQYAPKTTTVPRVILRMAWELI